MSEQLPMLFSDEYSLEGYVPRFTYQETLLGLHTTRVQVGGEGSFRGFGAWDDEDERYKGPPVYESRYSITVEGVEIHAQHYGSNPNDIRQTDTSLEVVAKIVNQFFANANNEKRYPAQWAWLKENTRSLNQSKRYWAAMIHLREIRKEEEKVEQLQRRIARGKLVAQLRAAEVLSGRAFTTEERQVKWAEISGGLPYEAPYEDA